MKILLVDDSPHKIKRVVSFLVEKVGIGRDDIVVAQCASEARTQISRSKGIAFDVLLLDVVLPLRPEDEPSATTSLELLEEIVERDIYLRPKQIIGLTAYEEAAKAADVHFADWLWTLIVLSEDDDSGLARIENCLAYMRAQAANPPSVQYDVDVCIVTALPVPEMEAILRLDWNWQLATPIDDMTFVQQGQFKSDGRACSVVVSSPTRMGMVSTGLLAAKLIQRYRPRLLAMTGVCAGVKGKANLGDIICADPSWDYQSGKRLRDKESGQSVFAPAPHQIPIDEGIRARMDQLKADENLWVQIRRGWQQPPDTVLKMVIGPVATGSPVVADGDIVASILAQNRTVCGIEMETYGLYAAAASANTPRPLVVALKSVCDFASPEKDDRFQAYAAYTSAMALKTFCERHMSALTVR